ncbi:nuclease-related domain-containing protein [Streptomyces netropsis]|uniref:nuclease-related domain-containing protein n=1 Tax=Streptomyces netropsis TaxID=55404 RepID=UPI0030D466A2
MAVTRPPTAVIIATEPVVVPVLFSSATYAAASPLLTLNGRAVLLAVILYLLSRAVRCAYPVSEEVRRWRRGAEGERRTARILAPLTRRRNGWVVLHDRALPRTRANLDHVILRPDGGAAHYCDSKALHPGARVSVRGGILYVGRRAYPAMLQTVMWEAAQAAQLLGVPVTPVIAVHGAKVPGGRIACGGITIIPARKLRRELTAAPYQRYRPGVERLAEFAELVLPLHRSD